MVLPKKELVHDVKFYKYPKVDSFDLYRNTVADSILRQILKKVRPKTTGGQITDRYATWERQKAPELHIRNAQNKKTYDAAK